MKINRTFLFDYTRGVLFDGRLNQGQVNGLNLLLDRWERDHPSADDRWLAYIRATVHDETDRKFQPIEEYGKGKHLAYGLPDSVTGQTYYGRGYCQLTWKRNYLKFGDLIGVDLCADPRLALDPQHALPILFHGMIDGLYTGRKLGDYIVGAKCDWVNARRIVNGTDKANLIAGHAIKFYAAISYTV